MRARDEFEGTAANLSTVNHLENAGETVPTDEFVTPSAKLVTMNRLILCAGRQRREGWLTLDADARVKPNILASIPPLPEAVTSRQWAAVELIHGIEHFYLWEARELLQGLRGVLAPGGTLILEQPNIRYAAQVLLGVREKPRGHVDQFDMWPLYGDPRHRNQLFGHKWGYSPESLSDLLFECGFPADGIKVCRARSHFPGRDFRVEAVVPAAGASVPEESDTAL